MLKFMKEYFGRELERKASLRAGLAALHFHVFVRADLLA